jgi:hypothetical protein
MNLAQVSGAVMLKHRGRLSAAWLVGKMSCLGSLLCATSFTEPLFYID